MSTRRLVAAIALVWFALLVLAPVASACINDREVYKTEREFRSQYNGEEPVEQEPEGPSLDLTSIGLTSIGGVMLLGAVVSVRRRETLGDD